MNKNVKRGIVCAALCVAGLAAVAAEPKKVMSEAEYEASIGGFFIKPGSFKGKIVVADAQKILDEAEVKKAIAVFATATEFNVVYAKSSADVETAKRDLSANVIVQLVEDEVTPALLVAPEDFWAKVNMKKVGKGLKSETAKKKFLVPRCRKEILRALLLVCGSGSSQYQNNVTNAALQPDIDLAREIIAVDLVDRTAKYLRPVGVTPKELVCYEQACVEGWAPAPTNDVQRKLMKAVRKIPTKPMAIKFDPSKGE